VLEITGLRKSFGETQAVKGASFCIDHGSCYGLLGPNGAGKTTMISIVTGTVEADGGTVFLDGERVGPDAVGPKKKIGYVPQDIALYEEINALDNLRFFGALYGLAGQHLDNRIEYGLELTGLKDRAKDPVAQYSGGMKRRLNIAAALLHEPDLIVLDEPTVGVDPQSRNAIFDALEILNGKGKTILYTTHYMEEVERVAIMDHGVVVAEESLAGIRRLLPQRNEVLVELVSSPAGALAPIVGTLGHTVDGATISLEIEDLSRDLPIALTALTNLGLTCRSVNTRQGSLEEVFLHLTGRSLRD